MKKQTEWTTHCRGRVPVTELTYTAWEENILRGIIYQKTDSDVGKTNLVTNLSIDSRSIFVKGHSNRLRSKGTCMNSDGTANRYNSGEWSLGHDKTIVTTSKKNWNIRWVLYHVRRTSTRSRQTLPTNHITIWVIRERSRKCCSPCWIDIVDCHKSKRTSISFVSIDEDRYIDTEKPRPKAICCDWGDTQAFNGAEPTLLRKPTMPLIAMNRCWQSQPPLPPVVEHVPTPATRP